MWEGERMTAALRADAGFLDLCRRNGVDPNSIPNAGQAVGLPLAAMPLPLEIAYRIGSSARGSHLDALGREIYANNLSDDDIGALEALIARQRQHQKASASRWGAIYGQPSKQPHDRKRAAMVRRGLVRLGWLPPNVANSLTPGEEAVAAIYAQDCRRKGFCDDSKLQLAERAGVVERVVQRAQKALVSLGFIKAVRRPVPRQRHATTIVSIVDPAWLLWLRKRRAPSRSPMGVGDCKGDLRVGPHVPPALKEAVEIGGAPEGVLQREDQVGSGLYRNVANGAEAFRGRGDSVSRAVE